MSSSSSSSYRRYNQDVSNKTHCDCKPPHPIPIQTAWTTDNPGRRFRGCPIRDKSKKCGVYGFLDLELPSDYYKGLVYSLHEENKALKRMNRMPVGVMDGTSGVVSNNSFADIGNVADIGNNPNIIFTLTLAVFTYFSVDQYGQRQRQSTRSLVPPPMKIWVHLSTDEYYADYDYWNTWVQDESTDEEDEDEVMTTKDDDLLFYQDTFPVDKFVPYGKAMGSKRIEKSPNNDPVSVFGSFAIP
ncbi:hypothetical protein Tco_0925397 [Tanacetum coccineum]|uniref:Zinc finger GRF-type domain-containing protein n=1 Tax=Tanacetum coccineum TaxID=301880 RepID=A0ABQ5D9J4_9ASTR